MKRKNIIAVTLWAAVMLSLGACQNKGKEAEEKAGFEITVPDQLNGMKKKIFLLWKRMERTSAAITERQIPLKKWSLAVEVDHIGVCPQCADTWNRYSIYRMKFTFR